MGWDEGKRVKDREQTLTYGNTEIKESTCKGKTSENGIV